MLVRPFLQPENIFSKETLSINSIVLKVSFEDIYYHKGQYLASLRELFDSLCINVESAMLEHNPFVVHNNGEVFNLFEEKGFTTEEYKVDSIFMSSKKAVYSWNDSFIKLIWTDKNLFIKIVNWDNMPSLGYWQEKGTLIARLFGQGLEGIILRAWEDKPTFLTRKDNVMSEDSLRVIKAIENIKDLLPDYFQKTLKQRLQGGAGSIFPQFSSEQEVEDSLRTADWKKVQAENLLPGTTAFRADISGLLGVVDLSSLDETALVTLDDRKNTGFVSCTISIGELGFDPRQPVSFSTALLGLEKGVEVLFTVHPGLPVSASRIEALEGLHGKKVTVKEAKELGLETAKVID